MMHRSLNRRTSPAPCRPVGTTEKSDYALTGTQPGSEKMRPAFAEDFNMEHSAFEIARMAASDANALRNSRAAQPSLPSCVYLG